MAFVPIALIVVQLSAPAGSDPATLRCTNPFSGTTWDVAIDHARRTAGSFPADITDKTIKWRDVTRGWRYEFDRASGELTIVYASSLGGSFLRNSCRFVRQSGTAPG